jgi:uncharacterized protein with NAD-binding domain and iron-sulfur cluster
MVFESTSEAGGFFRSARVDKDKMPSEYSWHGMGPWYHNVFDLLKTIPYDDKGSIYDRALSRPIDFGIFPNTEKGEFYDKGPRSIPRMFQMTNWETVKWTWLMFKTWASDARSEKVYARQNAAARWQPYLSDKAYRTWRACFGPWIGSDWTKVSLHHTGQFFRKQLVGKVKHEHRADSEGPAWKHGAGDGWLLFRGPSSEYWFMPWVRLLEKRGVTFSWNAPLKRLDYDGRKITSAHLESERKVEADHYILAANPFAVAEILERTPNLQEKEELKLFQSLVADGPHNQVSLRIAFLDPIKFPRQRTAVVVSDSEFNLTLFAEEQVWDAEVDLGKDIKSLWTVTACTGTAPGKIYGLPVVRCTKEQFIDEVKSQLFACESLNTMIKEANNGRDLKSFRIKKIEVWHEWRFSPDGIKCFQPKWVTTTNTQPFLPSQITPVPNLFLAGAHTRTEVDVWSIEGAVESGRRAAKGIDSRVEVLSQYKPAWLRGISRIDNLCFRLRLAHVLDLVGALFLIAAVVVCLRCLLPDTSA